MKREREVSIEEGRFVIDNVNGVVMFRQPTEGRNNGCWIPPVALIANAMKGEHDPTFVTVESVLASAEPTLTGGFDVDIDAIEILSTLFHINPTVMLQVYDDSGTCTAMLSRDPLHGETICSAWIDQLISCINGNGLGLLLVRRLEHSEGNQTHYLVIVGIEVTHSRRGGMSYSLMVKDPMEGDVVLVGQLEQVCVNVKPATVQLKVKLVGGGTDKYHLMECALYRKIK
jgi:hypothetical protein